MPFVKVNLCNFDKLACLSDQKTIIIVNHQSLIDMGFLVGFLGNIYSISKVEMKKIPFMNIFIHYSGNIWVDRNKILSIKNAMKKAGKYIEMGRQLHFFPEGTRSIDGKLQPFKKGAFKLAVRNNCGVLPICISGTRDFLAKDRLVITRVPIKFTLAVGNRVEICDDDMCESEKIDMMSKLCYDQIENLLVKCP